MKGVLQIWEYNRNFYLLTLSGIAAVSLAALWCPFGLRLLLFAGAGAAFLWTAASLAVSYWVYDRSSLYDFSWMSRYLGVPASLVNLHAGLDETSALLRAQFPAAHLRVFDFFDKGEMPEPSIQRARDLNLATAEPVDWRSLPADAAEFDAAFVIFAAHELRRREARLLFFRELSRVTRPGGSLIVIEHLRDLPNFLAFGPGFLHFFPRSEWLRQPHFQLEAEFRITPFVRVFVFRRPA